VKNPAFQFKQFTVFHHRVAMKVGVDSVLLGAWAEVKGVACALDIGTGCGLLALMIAQRNERANILAIEIDEEAAIQADENFRISKWKNRISIKNIDFRNFYKATALKFDLVICNPPYFLASLPSPDKARTVARHATDLPHEEILKGCSRLLANTGRLALILPIKEGEALLDAAESHHLFCIRKTAVCPCEGSLPKRLLLEFAREKVATVQENTIAIETGHRACYTPEYTALVKDFYLKM